MRNSIAMPVSQTTLIMLRTTMTDHADLTDSVVPPGFSVVATVVSSHFVCLTARQNQQKQYLPRVIP